MQCSICGQTFMITPTRCPACGYPIQELQDILGGKGQVKTKTHVKAIEFYKNHIRAGGWFELKKIGYQIYLYGRFRVGRAVKKSQYLGRI